MSSGNRFLRGLRLRLAYFSGYARLMERRAGGAGAILRFERVRPARGVAFQPHRAHEITPDFLDRTIRALKRWRYDIVGMDEVHRRAVSLKSPRRFVCLTFDGATRDLMTFGYPVLAKYGVPFTVYVPTAFPDGLGEAWWLALEAVIARNDRIAFMMDRVEKRFEIADVDEKVRLYDFLNDWMRSLGPEDLSASINDLCKRYSVDLAAVSREASMSWDDLAKLGADPNVTIASMTVNSPVLTSLKDAAAAREISMGKAVAQSAFHRDVQAFRLSVWRPRIVQSPACGAGPRGRLCQRGDGAARGDPARRPLEFARAAAHRVGWTATFAAHDAGDAVGGDATEPSASWPGR